MNGDIRQLPRGWAETTLGAVHLDLSKGVEPSRFPDETFELYSVPSYQQAMPEIIKGQYIGSNKQTVDPHTVLLCKINPRINRVWVTGNHSPYRKIASTEWIPFFRLSDLESRYLAYFLQQDGVRDFLAGNASGVGGSLMRVRAATFRDFIIHLAPLSEQNCIADTLDEFFSDLDAAVAALQRVWAKLTQYRSAVLKAAVEGTLTAEWRQEHPHAEHATELLKRILAERRRRWEEEQLGKFKERGLQPPKNWKAKYTEPVAPDLSKLPLLPTGWCWVTVDHLGEIGTGATPNRGIKGRYYEGGTIPWVTSTCVNSPFVRQQSEYVTSIALDECNLTLYPPGTLLLAMYGEGKTRGMCSELQIESTTNQALAAIQAYREVKSFLKIFLAKHYQDLRRAASGGVQPNLNLGLVREITLPLPPVAEQETIVETIEDQLSIIDHLEADIHTKLKNAHALRQAILHHAFTGQLVPQDPNDEPASELLKRIAAEREERVRAAAAARRTGKQSSRPRATAKPRATKNAKSPSDLTD